jgi:FlaA1/EpsC-like NDP-sugar epimerase
MSAPGMINNLIEKLLKFMAAKILSRWVILSKDIIIVWFSFLFAYVLRFNFVLTDVFSYENIRNSFVFVAVFTGYFLIFKSYLGIIRHTSISDAVRLFEAVTASSLTLLVFVLIDQKYFNKSFFNVPLSVVVVSYLIIMFSLIFTRIFIKLLYNNILRKEKGEINVLIYGAGDSGIIVKNTLAQRAVSGYKVVGFIDEDLGKIGKTLERVDIYAPRDITSEFIQKKNIEEIIFSIQNIEPLKKKEVLDELLKLGVVLKNIPPVDHWIQGKLNFGQIQRVKIEDLLQREAIKLDNPRIKEIVFGKTILVTGAAGSIGSELVRQLIVYNPAKLILIDQAETPLFELMLELRKKHPKLNGTLVYFIADVSNQKRMEAIFDEIKPMMVFHAAAYKHVPMMEDHPMEAVRVNIFGTRILADLSVKHKVETFVMISTDKAVKPTNVMGASKRFAEMYCQAMANENGKTTHFITTRFGNVLGSNGSVIKIFRKQIESGGPVSVTHPDITRFFMTIPEACQLVIEASVMGENSEIFIFDMGEPVKILDLAKKMIILAGYEPDKDIMIEFTGLRPGEKLYEELLDTGSEDVVQTYHPKIMIGKVSWNTSESMLVFLRELQDALTTGDHRKMVSVLKKAIPEYISKNSVYESLDVVQQEAITTFN